MHGVAVLPCSAVVDVNYQFAAKKTFVRVISKLLFAPRHQEMSERVEPINEARGLYSVGRSEWNVTHRFSVTEFLTGGGNDRQHDWCRGLDRDNANAPVVILRTGWNGWNHSMPCASFAKSPFCVGLITPTS